MSASTSTDYEYQDPFRPIYEAYSIVGWLSCAVGLALAGAWHGAPGSYYAAVGAAAVWGLRDVPEAMRLMAQRKRLAGRSLTFGSLSDLQAKMAQRPDAIWLGVGFRWGQAEAQLASEIKRRSPQRMIADDPRKGQPWLHGIGAVEEDVYLPIDHARGHTLIVGTTGSGKTRLLENLIAQAILRNEACIIIDPKGDKELLATARAVCAAQGRPDRFAMVHKAFAQQSIRLDPMKNFASSAQLATRVATLVARDKSLDAFSGFCQKTLKVIADGLLMVGKKPSLRAFLQYVEGGVDGLLIRTLAYHFSLVAPPQWQSTTTDARRSIAAKPGVTPDQATAKAYVAYYRESQDTVQGMKSAVIDGLIGQFEHDRTHAAKLLVSLIPILHMLTTGDLGELLSPIESDPTDQRDILDFRRIIENRRVLYIGLDSLSDPMVGTAMGSLLLADLASLAGDIYNYEGASVPIACFIDEAAECISDPTIALLNKGRGAGFSLTILTQTFADFAAAVGSEPKARMILGNANNLICQRIKDGDTQRYVAENVPETVIRSVARSQGASNNSISPIAFTGSVSESLKEETCPLIDPATLGCLPDLEFFANISGGHVYKVATPILRMEPNCGTQA